MRALALWQSKEIKVVIYRTQSQIQITPIVNRVIVGRSWTAKFSSLEPVPSASEPDFCALLISVVYMPWQHLITKLVLTVILKSIISLFKIPISFYMSTNNMPPMFFSWGRQKTILYKIYDKQAGSRRGSRRGMLRTYAWLKLSRTGTQTDRWTDGWADTVRQ